MADAIPFAAFRNDVHMPALLRFAGSTVRDSRITPWLDAQPPALGALARHWFAHMRRCGDDVRELLHDDYATVCVDDAPFAYVGAFTAHVNIGFFHGAHLPDPARLLQGAGKSMRHVALRPGRPVDEEALAALIADAYDDVVNRVRA